ncbi:SDR family oxidoreductase [Pelagibacterales bacterium]|jgi:short-subunit dehydrogenase|nr:SDR family oxidoreductase [Pelagibacterales bacterium]|tara:strand:+ start:3162 stop:3971 length:810 start_codon:yes stop_codon:yes gene_type:complete
MSYFDKKVVWVTGASSGIGKELAIQLSKLGAILVLTARRENELEKVKQLCGNAEVHLFPYDLENLENIEELYRSVTKEVNGIDILINNAGISAWSSVNETDLEVYKRVMNLDYFSVVSLTKSVLPDMIKKKSGQIVTNTSLMGKFSSKKRSVYASAKHALHGFVDALRAEVHQYNIKVNIVAPGYVNTEVGIKALVEDGASYGKNDRGHDSKGMKVEKAASIIINAIRKNKREVLVIPKFSILMVASLLSRFLPGIGAIVARNFDEDKQ